MAQYNENGWINETFKYLEEDSKYDPWDFTQGDTFDLLNEKRRQEIAHQYALFVKDELAKLN